MRKSEPIGMNCQESYTTNDGTLKNLSEESPETCRESLFDD